MDRDHSLNANIKCTSNAEDLHNCFLGSVFNDQGGRIEFRYWLPTTSHIVGYKATGSSVIIDKISIKVQRSSRQPEN